MQHSPPKCIYYRILEWPRFRFVLHEKRVIIVIHEPRPCLAHEIGDTHGDIIEVVQLLIISKSKLLGFLGMRHVRCFMRRSFIII